MTLIADNLRAVRQKIQECEKRYGRPAHSVFLLAISKKQPLDKMLDAIHAGQTAFGESYLQEAMPKITALADHPVEWHFVGPVQSNKTKKIAEHFHWVHSISDLRIAKRLSDQRTETMPPLNICLEVNVSRDPKKSGINMDGALELAQMVSALPRLTLRGLMTVPTAKRHFIDQRAEYYKLRLLFDYLTQQGISLDTLSMGMSQDMAAAIAESATIVRIGTDIFGSRQ